MGYCRRWQRTCSYCLSSRTLYIAPTEEGVEAIFLKYQPRKQEKTSCAEFRGWKNTKIRKQWMVHLERHQNMYEIYRKDKLIGRGLEIHDVEEMVNEVFNVGRLERNWLKPYWDNFEVKEIPEYKYAGML